VRRSLGAVAPDLLLRLHETHPDRYPALLESVGGATRLGRYDVLFALPGPLLQLNGDGSLAGPPAWAGGSSFLGTLDAWWSSERAEPIVQDAVPFVGGWFVYLGYELAGEIEPRLRMRRSLLPRALAWRMHGAVVRDRLTGEAVACAEPQDVAPLKEQLDAEIAEITFAARPAAQPIALEVEEDEPDRFLAGVEVILEAIAAGEVYQANLSRGWQARLPPGVGAGEIYRRLREANPAPFAGSARLPGFTVLSSSPERLLRIEGNTASSRPIAGTRPRGVTRARDASLRAELELNEKERAEHVMLVDLVRNDLGRICRGGTVRVDEFMTIESYATVHHIVSNVTGELRAGVTPGQAVAAVFPGGTITGCPKVRCMELLAGLERDPRDAYTGSMGYLGRDGTLDLNILIRTLTLRGDAIGFRTGAGIVADSRPEAELSETRAKARGLLRALGSET